MKWRCQPRTLKQRQVYVHYSRRNIETVVYCIIDFQLFSWFCGVFVARTFRTSMHHDNCCTPSSQSFFDTLPTALHTEQDTSTSSSTTGASAPLNATLSVLTRHDRWNVCLHVDPSIFAGRSVNCFISSAVPEISGSSSEGPTPQLTS